jgi:hypothetical protein
MESLKQDVFRMDNKAPKTISVPEAGKQYFGLAKNASYEAAARGEIPVIRIGGRLRVPVCQLERMLQGTKLTELAR